MPSYGRLCTEFYDSDKPNAPGAALTFYTDRAREAGGRILEPMCGSGRFLLPMRQAGWLVDGVDSSPAMLEACQSRARRLGIDVELYLQDLVALDLPHKYAMAFVPSGSIGLVTDDEDLRRAFARLRAHLEGNGTLLLEIEESDGSIDGAIQPGPRTVTCGDGTTITYTCVASPSQKAGIVCFAGKYEKRLGTRIVATETEDLLLRAYSAEDIVSALADCGFGSSKVFSQSELPFLVGTGCRLVEAR